MKKKKPIFVSPHYFELLAIALNDWGQAPRSFTDFADFLNNLKDGLKANRRDAIFAAIIREEVRMLNDPNAFEV